MPARTRHRQLAGGGGAFKKHDHKGCDILASLFKTPLTFLDKIGSKKAEQFSRLGIDSVGALLRFYPRTYEDWSRPCRIADAPRGENVCIKGTVESARPPARIRGNMTIFKLTVSDGDSYMTVTFFNQKYTYDRIKQGGEFIFYGILKNTVSGYEMTSPQVESTSMAAIRPIYPQTSELGSRQIERAVRQAVALLPEKINDPIPQSIREEFGLCDLGAAIRNIHFPADHNACEQARKRLVFEELFVLQLGVGLRSSDRLTVTAHKISKNYINEFLSHLPYKPTNAQRTVMDQCIKDMMEGSRPMNRLIQGDVGSGKTAVAAAVCHTAARNGLQCAFMVPTEILAEQHFQSLKGLFESTGLRAALLTGSTKQSERKQILAGLQSGQTDILIGTHALISDNVEFKCLGLVVTDEQHRFGVAQRAALTSKGDYPHMIVMSATPIPRTLALMIFGDLDLSVIDEMPPGRQPTETYLIDSGKRSRLYGFIKKHILKGNQCYIVCPLVEQNDTGLLSAEEYAEKLSGSVLSSCRIAVLHGRMKASEKEQIMSSFAAGETDILVSTTVIEVGVNVPNATIMVIENAERFGLSQLHQLRGRVGRGSDRSYCIMVSDASSPSTLERLKVMCSTNNGFIIADEDLRLRGPGDFFGTRQHGLPELRTAKLTDMISVEAAREAAQKVLAEDPSLSQKEHAALKFEVARLFRMTGS